MVTQSWQLFALGSAAFAAMTAIFGKLGVNELPSNLATLYRTVVVLVVLALIVTLRSEWRAPSQLSSRGLFFLTLSGCATGLSWLCYYRALKLGTASRVAAVDKLSVVLVLVLSLLFLGETWNWRVSCGAALITAGALLMSL